MLGTYALSAGYYDAYYGQAQQVRTLIRQDFARGVRRRRPAAHADLADGRVPARRAASTTRSRCTCPTSSRCRSTWPACRASRSRAGSSEGLPVGLQLVGPALRREPHCCARRTRSSSALGFDPRAAGDWRRACERRRLGGGHRPRDPRAAATRERRCSARCANVFGAGRTRHVCPVCLGYPGVLPVTNARRSSRRIQSGSRSAARSPRARQFHRKNYFYPDCPRRTRSPSTTSRSACRRAPGRRRRRGSASPAPTSRRTPPSRCTPAARAGASPAPTRSVVDFNRCGTPLLEIVTEPDLRSPEQARGVPDAAARPRAARSASPTATWRRARCAATPTCRCAAPARPASAPRPSSRT